MMSQDGRCCAVLTWEMLHGPEMGDPACGGGCRVVPRWEISPIWEMLHSPKMRDVTCSQNGRWENATSGGRYHTVLRLEMPSNANMGNATLMLRFPKMGDATLSQDTRCHLVPKEEMARCPSVGDAAHSQDGRYCSVLRWEIPCGARVGDATWFHHGEFCAAEMGDAA